MERTFAGGEGFSDGDRVGRVEGGYTGEVTIPLFGCREFFGDFGVERGQAFEVQKSSFGGRRLQ